MEQDAQRNAVDYRLHVLGEACALISLLPDSGRRTIVLEALWGLMVKDLNSDPVSFGIKNFHNRSTHPATDSTKAAPAFRPR